MLVWLSALVRCEVEVLLDEGLRFKGDTKGLWMPRESTRRRLAAGGVDMVDFWLHTFCVVFDVLEIEEDCLELLGFWRGR